MLLILLEKLSKNNKILNLKVYYLKEEKTEILVNLLNNCFDEFNSKVHLLNIKNKKGCDKLGRSESFIYNNLKNPPTMAQIMISFYGLKQP